MIFRLAALSATVLLLLTHGTFTVFAQESTDLVRLKAIKALEQGKYQETISIISKTSGTKTFKERNFILGLAYFKMNKFEQAVSYFKMFEADEPDNKEFHYYLGECNYRLGNYQAALDEFRKSELLNVRVEESTYYSGYIYFTEGNYKKAFGFFTRAIKEEGPFQELARFYAGISLYKDGLEDPEALQGAVYQFNMIKDPVLAPEAEKYIAVINEYLQSGLTRYKKRWNLNAKADLAFSSNRISFPVQNAPHIYADTQKKSMQGRLAFKSGFAPLIIKQFAFFLLYDFSTDLGFAPGINYSNSQSHSAGLGVHHFSRNRSWEAGLSYYYHIDLLDQSRLHKLCSANVFEVFAHVSLTKTWSVEFKIPVRLYSGSELLGDFSGKSYEFSLASYLIFKSVTLRIEPSYMIFSTDVASLNANIFHVDTRLNFPTKIWFFWPGIKFDPYFINSETEGSKTAYTAGVILFVPLGLGIKGTFSSLVKNGFAGPDSVMDWVTGIGFEYVF